MEQAEQSEVKRNQKRTISIEDVAWRPSPGLVLPGSIQFSADDNLITYLFSPDDGLSQNLYAFDPQTGIQELLLEPSGGGTREETVSQEEELRRERVRQVSLGVTSYTWSDNGQHILLPMQGSIFILDMPGRKLRMLVDCAEKPAMDAQFSPDSKWVSYVQDAEIYVIPVEGGLSRQVTQGARGTGKTNGLAEYIAQEEMNRRRGYWWSPDSRSLAFTEVDETHIPVYRIMHQGKDITGEGAQEDHRYPFVGTNNAKVRLAVISLDGGEPVWMDYRVEDFEYLARVDWMHGDLYAQLENRAQTEINLVRFDTRTGMRETIFVETNQVWINLHDLIKPLKKIDGTERTGFVWASERSGFRHLYLYDAQGRLVRSLTCGEWLVEDIAGVDEENETVYFTANKEDVCEIQFYAVSLRGGEPRRISQQAGFHQVVLDHAKKRYIDVRSDVDQPPVVELRSLDGAFIQTIYKNEDVRLQELDLQPPELVTLQNRGGITLYGAIYHPPASFGKGPFPTIISVYGGPTAQLVTRQWSLTAAMQEQYLASQGFLVFRLDNTGSARRGLAFEGLLKHRCGQPEVQDQVDGVHYLAQRGLCDLQRVGVFGWSYGGFMSAMCLAQEPEVFKVAVAGAPAIHYDGYDTHYTERYMSTPQANPEGYELGSVQHYVKNLRGRLLIVHGLIDENVHFRHTARLINCLIDADKDYDLLLLPDSRHVPRKPSYLLYMLKRMSRYFLAHL